MQNISEEEINRSNPKDVSIMSVFEMIINSGQKVVEVFCVALVTYKLTII